MMEKNTFYFSPADFLLELKREQRMRKKVWRTRSGGGGKFVSPDHQKQYDAMDEILLMLETLGVRRIELLQLKVIDMMNAQQKLNLS